MQAAYRQHISTLWHDNTLALAAKKTDRCCAEFYTLPDYAPPSVGRFRGGEGLGLGVATRQRFQRRWKQGCWIHHNTCPPVPISQSGPATPWTHIWSSGQPFMLRSPGEQLWVWCLAQEHLVVVLKVLKLYIHSPHRQFLPDRDSNTQPLDYESDSLNTRPRLPSINHHRDLPNSHHRETRSKKLCTVCVCVCVCVFIHTLIGCFKCFLKCKWFLLSFEGDWWWSSGLEKRDCLQHVPYIPVQW